MKHTIKNAPRTSISAMWEWLNGLEAELRSRVTELALIEDDLRDDCQDCLYFFMKDLLGDE